MVIRADVNSSAIHSAIYDTKTQMLTITFNSNLDKGYDYPDVGSELFEQFLRSDSKGQFFHKHLKQYARY